MKPIAFALFFGFSRCGKAIGYIVRCTETVAKYTNRITESGNFEFLVPKIPHFASQSVPIQGK